MRLNFCPTISLPQPIAALRQNPLLQRIYTAVATFFTTVAAYIKLAAQTSWRFIKRSIFCIRPLPPIDTTPGVSITPVAPYIAQSVSINQAALPRIPIPFDPSNIRYLAAHANPPIETNQIIAHFNQQFDHLRDRDVLYNDQGSDVSVRQARSDIQTHYLNFIRDYRNGEDYHRRVAENIEIFLQGIIFELRKPEVPLEKKQEALKNLASAARHCPPRRHEQVMKIYRTLSNQMETLEDILLQYTRQAKEDLFLNYYSLSNEPVMTLNKIRQTVGQELGLDCHPINLSDPHIVPYHDARSPENRSQRHTTAAEFRNTFQRIFTPDNYLSLMKYALNQRIAANNDFTAMVSQFIGVEIDRLRTEGLLTQAEVDTLPEPYQYPLFERDNTQNKLNPYHLTDQGVRFLLVHFNLLTPLLPNGHLVRLPPPYA